MKLHFNVKSGESFALEFNDVDFSITAQQNLINDFTTLTILNLTNKIALDADWEQIKKFNAKDYTSVELYNESNKVFEITNLLEMNYNLEFTGDFIETLQLKFK